MPNTFTNGNLAINGASSSHNNSVPHSNNLNNNTNHQINLSNNANTNSTNSLNPFMQMSYPNMINATSLGMDGLGGNDDTH